MSRVLVIPRRWLRVNTQFTRPFTEKGAKKRKVNIMRYVTLLRFTEQGIKQLNKSLDRAESFRAAAAKAGVNVEAQYWTTGPYDGVLILSANDETNALRCLA